MKITMDLKIFRNGQFSRTKKLENQLATQSSK